MACSEKFLNYVKNLLRGSIYQFANDISDIDNIALMNIKEYILGNGMLPNISSNSSMWTDELLTQHYDIVRKYIRIKKGKKGTIEKWQANYIRKTCYEVMVLPKKDINIYSKEEAAKLVSVLKKLENLPDCTVNNYFVYGSYEESNKNILDLASEYFSRMYWNF